MNLENLSEIEIMLIVASFIIVLLFGMIIYLIIRQNTPKTDGSMKLLQDHIFNLTNTFDARLSETNKNIDIKLSESNKMLNESMNKTFDTTSKIGLDANKNIEQLTKKLTELGETNKQIQDIGWQLRGLENVLKNPKQRWNLWEYFLNELLDNVFTPDQYQTQYQIHGKELKNDIKKRIAEASKYIALDKNTTDFAFMLIPAEWMYYDIFINKLADINAKSLIEYAFKQKVIICSPSWFYAYLQTVIQGLKSMQIEEQAKEIQKYVMKLQEDLERFETRYKSLWKSLGTAVKHYWDANTSFKKIDKDILKITEGQAGGKVELLTLEKPVLEG